MSTRLSMSHRITSVLVVLIAVLSFLVCTPLPTLGTEVNSKIANYYLGELQDSRDFIQKLARYDLLVLTPTQILLYPQVLDQIKKLKPNILIFAYVPTQSYNTTYWVYDPLFRDLQVENSWWLTEPGGATIEHWHNLKQIDMQEAWSRYLVDFVHDRIATLPQVDGIFFDLISENISWLNNGNIDLNEDRIRDNPYEADALWKERTTFFLSYAKEKLGNTYILMNGSSNKEYQPLTNGRMFETFPTPWEGDGSWKTIMNNIKILKEENRKPSLYVLNSNTQNTGNVADYKTMRYGFTSALLEDLYFGFDYGDTNHGQLWWYDEYGVLLGEPIGDAYSQSGKTVYTEDVWFRKFTNGMVVVNSTHDAQTIPLDGIYERLRGTQDRIINDGSRVSEITLDGGDGAVLLNTMTTLKNIVFPNGSFARSFSPTGERIRNGFFTFNGEYKGGAQLLYSDLDSNNKDDVIVVSGNKIQAWRDDGQSLFKIYPYSASYHGTLQIAVGDLNGDGIGEIYTAPGKGFGEPIKIFNSFGEEIISNFRPLGARYKGGYYVAVSNKKFIIGAGSGVKSTISIYNEKLKKMSSFAAFEATYRGGVSVAVGDIDGDSTEEIIATKATHEPVVKIFSFEGKEKYPSFVSHTTSQNMGTTRVGVEDVNFDGIDDIVTLSSGSIGANKVTENLYGEARYYTREGDQLGRGPLSPRVGTETVYAVVFTIQAPSEDMYTNKFSVVLSEKMRVTGKMSVSQGDAPTYTTSTRMLQWKVGALPKGTYATIFFEVGITPQESEYGTSPILIDEARVESTGYDGSTYVYKSDPLDIRIPADPQGRSKGDIVGYGL